MLDIDPAVVHIWRLPLALTGDETITLQHVTADEIERADRFVFERDRSRYLAAHSKVRRILGRYLGVSAYLGPFEMGPHGKPHLTGVQFNLSHSRDTALLAVSRQVDVGIDLEAVDDQTDIIGVAASSFSFREQAGLFRLPSAEQRLGFFHLWSQKEAYLKGRGDGIAFGLDHFDMESDPNLGARLLEDRRDPAATGQWWLSTVNAGPGFRAALAVKNGASRVDYFEE